MSHVKTLPHGADGARLHPQDWPAAKPPIVLDPAIEARIDALLEGMTLAQKIGQVVQGDMPCVTPEDVAQYHLGTLFNGGNSSPGNRVRAAPAEWLAYADACWEAAVGPDGTGIPTIWGTDAVHGHNDVVGATIFPHNVGLGAANDESLMERIGRATALEMRATGIDWTFAPTLAVVRDDRWGRSYESYSEAPEVVARLGAALIRGLQGDPSSEDFLGPDHVLATAKHFLGDGGTAGGRDQGDTEGDEAILRDIHAPGYVSAIEAGVQTVMASFSSWQGQKMHGFADVLTGVLKERWAFDGFLVGDWNGHGQLPGCTETDCPDALLAGLDLYMAPDGWKTLIGNLTRQVEDGTIPMERLDDAVRRILRVKFRAGVMDAPRPGLRKHGGDFDLLGCEAHAALADEAVRKSSVLLKNEGGLLPLEPGLRVLVTGDAADDIGIPCGGWTLSWQGGNLTRADYPHAETLLDGIKRIVGQGGGVVDHSPDGQFSEQPDVAIIAFGEAPYAEFRGDLDTLDFCPGTEREAERMRRLTEAGIPVVAVFYSGRPLWVNPELNAADAFVAGFLPGTRAGALADLLFADATGQPLHDFTGRLAFSWPRDPDQYRLNAGETPYDPLFPLGYGLSLADRRHWEMLHETGLMAAADRLKVFDQGGLIGGWSLELAPEGAVTATPADHGRQENALALHFASAGAATFRHSPMDMTRECNGDIHLRLFFAASEAAARSVVVSFLSGAGETVMAGGLSLSEEADGYRLDVSLKRAPGLGADMTRFEGVRVSCPFESDLVLIRVVFEMITA